MRTPSLPGYLAALATAGIGVTLGVLLSTGGPERRDARLLVLAFVVALLVAAARAATRVTALSRLSCVALAVTAAAGTLLSLTVGLPSAPPSHPDPESLNVIALGCLVPVLVLVDVARGPGTERSYAP